MMTQKSNETNRFTVNKPVGTNPKMNKSTIK